MSSTKYEFIDGGVFESFLTDLVSEELNKKKFNSPVKMLKDFSAEEIKKIEKEYHTKVIIPFTPKKNNHKNNRNNYGKKGNNFKRKISKRRSRSR